MATRIRLARGGSKKRPYYRIVVADKRSPRDGKFIEKIGTFNPLLPKEHDDYVRVKDDRVKHWLGTGATMSERVEKIFFHNGVIDAAPMLEAKKKLQAKRDEEAKAKAEQEAKLAAEQEAKEKAEQESAEQSQESYNANSESSEEKPE